MTHETLTLTLWHEMLSSGYYNLKNNEDTVNHLNVFPVPDGDTGINMSRTIHGGVIAGRSVTMEDFYTYMGAFSKGALLSARGNSGAIFSQFIAGMAAGAPATSEISLADFSKMLTLGTEYAYKAVITPTEGTILTVIRETAEFVAANLDSYKTFEDCFTALLPVLNASLDNTPNLLPILMEAGVIDSGGAGIQYIFEGMYSELSGKPVASVHKDAVANNEAALSMEEIAATTDFNADSELEFGYCTEFILQLMNKKVDPKTFDLNIIVDFLKTKGDSIVAVKNDDVIKIHVHTFTPEEVLAFCHQFGEFVTLKIENMSVQHHEVMAEKEQVAKKKHTKYAVVAVVNGEGIKEYFTSIGATEFVEGGQTCNPSTGDFIDSFKKINSDYIVVLPNNSNVILAAKQAASLYKDADVRVVETKSIAEGFSALSMMDMSAETIEAFIEGMTDFLYNVTTGYITTSTRDASINGVDVKEGNYIGLDSDTIRSTGTDKIATAIDLLSAMPDIDEKEVVTIFYGADASDDEKEALTDAIEKNFPMIEIGEVDGGQAVYDFIFALE